MISLVGTMLPETISYRNRVTTDGGVVINLLDVDKAIRHAKANGYWSSVAFWTSAQFGVKKDGSNAVSVLYDLKGNDATQGTGSAQPIWTSNHINGRSVLTFDGSNHYLIANISGLQSVTIMSVMTVVSPAVAGAANTTYGTVWWFGDSILGNQKFMFGGGGTSAFANETWSCGGNVGATSMRLATTEANFDWAANEAFIETFTTGDGTKFYKNATQLTVSLASNATVVTDFAPADSTYVTDNNLVIGGYYNSGTGGYIAQLNSDMGSMLVLTAIPSNLAAIQSFVSQQFGTLY